jgi:hypothetical protein
MDLENYWHKKDKPLDFPENRRALVLLVLVFSFVPFVEVCAFPPSNSSVTYRTSVLRKVF